MTQEEIIEGRILIENFMELRVDSFPNGLSDSWYVDHKNPDSVYNGMSPNEAKFHSSWDWIIPVVEKINKGWQCQIKETGYDAYGDYTSLNTPDNWFQFHWDRYELLEKEYNEHVIEAEKYGETFKPEHRIIVPDKKTGVWMACVEAIKWYNQNKQP